MAFSGLGCSACRAAVGGLLDFLLHFVADALECLAIENPLVQQPAGIFQQRIAGRFRLTLSLGFVELFVVGKRMGVRPDNSGVNQRRPLPRAAIGNRALDRPIGIEEVGAVGLQHQQARESTHQARHVAPGGLPLDRNADGVSVVFYQEQNRQTIQAGEV